MLQNLDDILASERTSAEDGQLAEIQRAWDAQILAKQSAAVRQPSGAANGQPAAAEAPIGCANAVPSAAPGAFCRYGVIGAVLVLAAVVVTGVWWNKVSDADGYASRRDDYRRGPTIVPAPALDLRAMELSFWESVRNSTSPSVIQTYLDRYPAGEFVPIARSRIQDLLRSQQSTARPAPPQQPNVVASLQPPNGIIPRRSEQPGEGVNCASPGKPIETLICADADLAEWDGRMYRIYIAKSNNRKKQFVVREQRDWIKRREAQCGVPKEGSWSVAQLAPKKPCVLQMIRQRANELASR